MHASGDRECLNRFADPAVVRHVPQEIRLADRFG